MVTFNEGAYLTRFDDDFDDMLPNAQLGPFSGNNPANGCAEGPAMVNNPFRDRNRAVWVSVIGIYPGADPAKAKHHTALRRFYVADASTPPSLLRVGGDLTTGHLKFCSETGDIAVHGDATLSNQTETCGTLQATNTITNSSTAADCAAHGISCSHGTDTSGIVFSDPVTVPSPSSSTWYTWSSGCNFYVDKSGDTGLFYWDVATPMCAAHGGAPPTPAAAGIGSCWIPLICIDGGNVPRNALGWPSVVEVGGGVAEFRPHGSNISGLAVVDAACVAPQGGRNLGSTKTHPQWNTCQGASPYGWRPPGGGTSVACQDCALGNERAMSFNLTTFSFNPTDPEAVPAGVYFINDDHTFATMTMGLPGTDIDEPDWPQATFIVDGNAAFWGSGRIGIGTKKGPTTPAPKVWYPSLVVGGNLTVGAGSNWAYGGAVWVGGNATFAGGSNVELYGPLTVAGNLTVGGGGKLDVVLTTNMVPATQAAVVVAATGSRTLR